VLNVNKTEDYLAFYSGLNDTLLAFIPEPIEYSAAEIFAIFQLLWQYYDMDEEFATRQQTSQATARRNSGQHGTPLGRWYSLALGWKISLSRSQQQSADGLAIFKQCIATQTQPPQSRRVALGWRLTQTLLGWKSTK
jgi:hypothetical protein